MKIQLIAISFFFITIINLSAQVVTIPDVNFRNALLTHSPVIDVNNDGLIQVSEAEDLLNLYIPGKSISDLTGIEAFTNLKSLHCTDNNLTSIDLSHNLSLLNLELADNNITSIDISKNTTLQILGLQNNGLTSIDVSKNLALRELKVEGNKLTTIDVSQNTSIWYLNVSDNLLTGLYLNTIKYLAALRCGNNPFTTLSLSCNINLSFVDATSTVLTSICLNTDDYTARTAAVDPDGIYWTKSATTAWQHCPATPTVTPVPATIVPIDLCESGDMTFNAVSEEFIANPTYKWQKAASAGGPWSTIAGATNQQLKLTNLQMADNGSIYKVLISSADYCGTGHMEEAAGKIILHPLVYPKVTASASVSGPVCDTIKKITYTAVPVSGAGTDPAYQWYTYTAPTYTPISGATNIQYTPAVLPPNGTQLFAGLFTDEMCAVSSGVSSNILTVEILPTPAPVITTSNIALCNPSGYEIKTANTAISGTQFQWYKDGSPITNSNTPSFTIASEGTYHLTENNGACTMASGSVTIDRTSSMPDPQVTISTSLSGPACDTLQQITYTAKPGSTTTGNLSYQWYNAATNSLISGATNIMYTPAAKPVNGDQVYVMIHTDASCVANPDVKSNTLIAEIIPTPAPLITTTNVTLCKPSGYKIETNNTAASGTQFQWYKNGNAIANSNTSVYTIADAGIYHMTEDNGVCQIASGIVAINQMPVSPDPEVAVASSITGAVCDTLQQITYTAKPGATTTGNLSYQWYNAVTNSLISGAVTDMYTPAAKPANGDKVYVIIHTDAACVEHADIKSNTITTEILPAPTPVLLSKDTAICMLQPHILSAQASSLSHTLQWYKNGSPVDAATNKNYKTQATEPTKEIYHITESNKACTMHSNTVTIEWMQTPVIHPMEDIYAVKGEQITLHAHVDHAAYYQWNPESTLTNPTTSEPTFKASESITYTLQASNNKGLCPVSETVNIIIKSPIKIPNVITANGDGVNDTWEIENIQNYPNATFEIYNRWGTVVWKSTGYSKQWNGSDAISGKMLPAGTYFYIVDLNGSENKTSYTGYIQLIN